MKGDDRWVLERLSEIQSICERTLTVDSVYDRNARSGLIKQQEERMTAFMDRMHDEKDNGKNEALRQFAEIEYSFFSKFHSVTKKNTEMLLRRGTDLKDAEEESCMLSLEYLLDMVEQLLRLICISTLNKENHELSEIGGLKL